jgi:hypothetical protein
MIDINLSGGVGQRRSHPLFSQKLSFFLTKREVSPHALRTSEFPCSQRMVQGMGMRLRQKGTLVTLIPDRIELLSFSPE